MTEYAPGTIAKATVRGQENVMVIRLKSDDDWYAVGADVLGYVYEGTGQISDIRPLVVLDLEDPAEAVRHLRDTPLRAGKWNVVLDIADVIEAQTTKPRPPEPQGLGAVVRDREGDFWVQCRGDHPGWQGATWENTRNSRHAKYEQIEDPTVTHEGWTE